MSGICLIVNPTSGRGAGKDSIEPIRTQLSGQSLSYQLFETQRMWHAAELAQTAAAQNFDVVVAVGGDGTANEVLNGLMLARAQRIQAGLDPDGPAMGVISVGRGNDLAYGWGIPPGVDAGVQTLVDGKRQVIDVGLARGGDFPHGRYFGNGVGIGFDAVVGFEAVKMTWLHGFPNYIIAALKTIFLYYKAPLVRLEYNGSSQELSTLMVSIMNGRRMGGGFYMAPNASIQDAHLDLCIVGSPSKGRVLTLIPYFMKGTQATQPEVTTAQAQRLRVTALKGSLPAHADGETLCTAGRSMEIEILPGALEVVTPLI